MNPSLALDEGRAFVDLSAWVTVEVRGTDARAWLNDLVTAEVADLETGRARPSLLLSPTGRIRAAFTVAAVDRGFLLVQDPGQPAVVADLLEPYVLSSDVTLRDRSHELALVAFPGDGVEAPEQATAYRPSALGPGTDVVGRDREALRRVAEGLVEADPDAADAWRIRRGVARFGVDLTTDSLPHEASLDEAIAYAKGCFLGQEAVAKVRNLGHPTAVVLTTRSNEPVVAGDPVMSDGIEVGSVTSATTEADGGIAGLVRVRWAARDTALTTSSGARLTVGGPASGP